MLKKKKILIKKILKQIKLENNNNHSYNQKFQSIILM